MLLKECFIKREPFGFPDEIFNALKKGHFSLVIKGNAGTGKTTLALEIIRGLPKGSSLYLTTRVLPEQLYSQFPWIKEHIDKKMIIDARQTRIPMAKSTFENIQARNITIFLKELHQRMVELNTKPVTLIIDSIDAIKTAMGIEWSDFEFERSLIELVTSLSGNIIFVVERSDVIKLDFLVDGVVTLKRKSVEGRILRIMEIEKLRGERIINASIIFTLHDSRFNSVICKTAYENSGMCMELKNIMLHPKDTDKKLQISSQIEILDEILGGGFSRGSFNVIEIRKDVGDSYIWFFLPMIINALRENKLIYLVPPAGIPYSLIMELFSIIEPLDTIKRKTIFFAINFPRLQHQRNKNIFYMDAMSLERAFEQTEDVITEAQDRIKSTGVIGIVGVDALEYTYGIEQLRSILTRWVTTAKGGDRAVFAVIRKNQEIKNEIVQLSDTHFVFEVRNNTLLFYGRVPWTKYYTLITEVTNNTLHIDLLPID